MKEFFVGLMVVVMLMILSVVGILLLPLIVVLGFFLKCLISVALLIFAVWLIGKATLIAIEKTNQREGEN